MSEEWRWSLKLFEPRSFDVYKNAAAPIIAMLGRLELDTEVSDTSIETVESNDCREMSKRNRDTNSVLAVIQERVRFSYKDRRKFINPFTQSISGLCKRQQTWESDNTVRHSLYWGRSLQDRLRDKQTCETTLASAYVLHHLSAMWSQLQMLGRSLRWEWVLIGVLPLNTRDWVQ